MNETSNINVAVPKELRMRCKASAIRRGINMKEFVNDALICAVEKSAGSTGAYNSALAYERRNSATKQPRKHKTK